MSNITITRITRNELILRLARIAGATFATLKTETEVKMNKTNNPYYGRVTKTGEMNVTLNFIYANSVNNQRTKEGNDEVFVPHQRKWGVRIEKTPFVEHNGKMYLEAKCNAAAKNVQYFLDGILIDKAQIEAFLPVVKSGAEHQGVEKEIIVRDFAMESIRGINFGGNQFQIV